MKIEVDLENLLQKIESKITKVESNVLKLQTKFNMITVIAGGFGTIVGAVVAAYLTK